MDPFADFKFQIGQRVRHVGGERGYDNALVVVARTLEQCSGGVQKLYAVSVVRHGDIGRATLHEVELTADTGQDDRR